MLLAEELDADWAQVRFEFVPVDRDYYNFGMLLNGQPLGDPAASWGAATGTWAIRQAFRAMGLSMTISSSSTVDAWDTIRPAGAAARQMLIAAAAERWETDPATLSTRAGRVIDAANSRSLGYGELAEAASRIAPPSDVTLKDPAEWQLVGKNPPRLDTPAKGVGYRHVRHRRRTARHAVMRPSCTRRSRARPSTRSTQVRRSRCRASRPWFPAGKPGAGACRRRRCREFLAGTRSRREARRAVERAARRNASTAMRCGRATLACSTRPSPSSSRTRRPTPRPTSTRSSARWLKHRHSAPTTRCRSSRMPAWNP